MVTWFDVFLAPRRQFVNGADASRVLSMQRDRRSSEPERRGRGTYGKRPRKRPMTPSSLRTFGIAFGFTAATSAWAQSPPTAQFPVDSAPTSSAPAAPAPSAAPAAP